MCPTKVEGGILYLVPIPLDLIFKVTAGLKLPYLSQKVLVCTISHELVGRFQPDLHGYNIGT